MVEGRLLGADVILTEILTTSIMRFCCFLRGDARVGFGGIETPNWRPLMGRTLRGEDRATALAVVLAARQAWMCNGRAQTPFN